MALSKVTYVDGVTIIGAKNLNDIQDELIRQGEQQTADEEVTAAALALKADKTETYTKEQVDAIAEQIIRETEYSNFEMKSVSGDFIHITDGAGLIPVKDLKIGIDAVQDLHGYDYPWIGGVGKNKFNYDDVTSLSGLSNNNGVFTNTDTDTRISFSPAVQLLNGRTIMATATMSGAVGRNSATFTIADTITTLRIKHNGASRDLRADYPFTQTGTFTISMTVTANNPSMVGGLSFKDVQIESGSTATSYAPYSNICPISGWDEVNVNVSGINVWDEEWEVGYISVSNGNNSSSSVNIRSKNYIPVLPNTSYYLKSSVGTVYCPIIFYDANKNFVSSVAQTLWNRAITTPSNASYMRFYMHDSYGTTYKHDISINYPSTDHDYHAYNRQTYTIDLDGTRYGGTLDVTSGLLTITHEMFDGGNKTWTKVTGSNYRTFYTGAANRFLYDANTPTVISSNYKSVCNNVGMTSSGDNYVAVATISRSSYVAIKDTSKANMTEEEFKTAMIGVVFVAKLLYPQTVQLTPTQVRTMLGTNNLWNQMNSNNELAYRISNALN